jgi:glycyl-tRNA synthetase beta chain
MNFLLEIGTEEIPHWMIPGALKQLAALDLFGSKLTVDATPRRLVGQAPGLPLRTPDEEQIVKGPPISAGEKAAFGFAKKQGVDPSTMQKSGDYYELHKLVPGRRAIDILAETLPAAILSIQWPKTMYWTGKSGPRFIRPIRWIVALLGDEVIPFEIAGVRASNITRGHRQLGSSNIPVTIETYEPELRRNHVILSSHERRHKIEAEAANFGAKIDTDLLETLTFITEYPTAIKGAFDPAFLELPSEVLTTVMRHHQKYFSVEGPKNLLEPNFVAIMNTSGDPEGLVQHGNERVLKARFNDARFFWNVDQVKKLEDRVEDLAKVTFQAKLGSYKEKTDRVVELVKELGGNAHAQRAALLAKTDLTTEMVKEFTELQGVVGGLYAHHQGEREPVWKAIYEHYQPVSMEDSIPESKEGQLVSLADKLDTLRECFRIGLVPTGSKDPFALRRAAQGVVRILAEGRFDFTLDQLATGNAALYAFFVDRAQYYFREIKGFKYDEVNAVLANTTLADMWDRLIALACVRPTENFEPLAASFKRIQNILKQANFAPAWPLKPDLLEPGPELYLYERIKEVRDRIGRVDYKSALESIASVRPAVDAFFDGVLVNAPEEAVRANRLTLLYDLLTDFSTIADFSEIVTSGDQK